MKVIGRNAVTEALKSGSTIDRLIAARDLKDAGAQRIINDAKSRGIKIFSTIKKCWTARRRVKSIRGSSRK